MAAVSEKYQITYEPSAPEPTLEAPLIGETVETEGAASTTRGSQSLEAAHVPSPAKVAL